LSLFFLAHVLLLIALPLMSCLSLLLKLGPTLRGKVSRVSTLEALDVSQISFLVLILSHHLGILDLHWMPCSSSPSCFLLHHYQVITIMVGLDLSLGCLFLLNLWLLLRLHMMLHQLLGWAH